MYNKCLFIGNLTRDPEIKPVGTSKVCKFGIAMNHRTKAKEEVCFVDIVAWDKTAEFVAQYFKKGNSILVEGRLKLETWEKDGKQNSKHIVIAEKISFIGGKSQETDAPMINESKKVTSSVTAAAFDQSPVQKAIGENNLDFDELPF